MKAISPNCLPQLSCSADRTFLDITFAAVLFLAMTDLYRFIALWAGLSNFAPVAGVFTLAAVGYALVYRPYTCIPFSRLIAWTTFVVLVPLASLTYSLNPNLREAALQVFYLALLWGSKAFFSRDATKVLRARILDAALVIGFAGVLLSIVRPSLFAAVARSTDDEIFFQGRGYGFYLQPNVCAASLTLLFFLWLFVRKPKMACRAVFTMAYLLIILLTGSRGGMVMSVFLISFHALLVGAKWDVPRLGNRLLRFAVLGGTGLILLLVVIFHIVPNVVPNKGFVTLQRIRSLAKLRDLAQDDAMGSRLEHQRAYLSLLAERPILGYGMGSARAMRERGLLTRTSHNTFIEYGFMYGIAGIVVWFVVVFMTWQDCFALRWMLLHKIDLLFLGVVFLACMVSNTVLANRILYVILGWLLAQRYPRSWESQPDTLSQYHASEGVLLPT